MIPLYLLGFNIYTWGMQTVRKEITNTMVSQVDFYMDNLEMDIQRMRALQYELLNDEDLNNLAVISDTMGNYEKSRAILRLQQRLNAIKSSSSYIFDIRVHIPSIDMSISPLHSPDNLQEEEFNMLWKARPESDFQIVYWEGKLLLSVIHPVNNFSGNKLPLYAIIIELSKDSLNKALQQFNSHRGSGAFLIYLPYDYIVAKNEPEPGITDRMLSWLKNQEDGNGIGGSSIEYNGNRYLSIYTKSDYLNMTLCKYIPEDEVFSRVRQYSIWFLIFSLLAVIFIALYALSTYKFIHEPLQVLVESFRMLEKGNLNIFIRHDYNDEFRYIYQRFNDMVERLNTLINQVYKQKILNQKAEFKQLQSQINPHFLYNSFFILSRMIKGRDYENSMEFARQLGNYFQFITRSAADEVPLDKEVEHARIYARIQEMRFSRRLRVEFQELPKEYSNLIVPRLIIQPIIENAFEHGLDNKTSGGLIRVTFHPIEEGLKIVIEDNGEELSEQQLDKLKEILASHGNEIEYTGILNINQRIKLKFGDRSGLNLSRSELGGLKVEMYLLGEGIIYNV